MTKEYSVELTKEQILQIIKEMVAYEDTEGEKKDFWKKHDQILEKLEEVLIQENQKKRASS